MALAIAFLLIFLALSTFGDYWGREKDDRHSFISPGKEYNVTYTDVEKVAMNRQTKKVMVYMAILVPVVALLSLTAYFVTYDYNPYYADIAPHPFHTMLGKVKEVVAYIPTILSYDLGEVL